MRRVTLYFAIATLTASAAGAQGGYLTYSVGSNPNGVTAADLNSDGKADLIIANSGSNSLTILLNNGSGTFNAAAIVQLTGATATLGPRTVVVADLNGDHKLDLIVVGYSGLAVLLGNGDGTFQTPQLLSPAVAAVSVADLNGDGAPDIAFTYLTGGFIVPTGAALSILSGNGDGSFRQGPTFSVGLTPWAVPGIGDFNGDGKPDIAVAVGQSLIVFLNDGKANFQTQITAQAWNFAPGIVAGDFNGDGFTDLAVTGQSVAQGLSSPGQGIITILLGKGDGTFQTLPATITPTIAQTIAAADLNGDGHPDLLAGLTPPAFFAGRGDGTFAAGDPLGGSGTSGYVAFGSFTGTGLMGVAGTNASGNVEVLPRVVWPSLGLQNLSAAAFGIGPLAQGSIAAAFGSGLATQTAVAANSSLPEVLGGDSVTIMGSDGKVFAAQLYYVSPGQVNYVIPTSVAPGLATVTIQSKGTAAATGQVDIEPVAPQLFTLNSSSLAAANVIRVNPVSAQTYLPVFQLDSGGNLLPLPIDLSSTTDSVFLAIYGTGIRNVSAQADVICTIDGTNAQVSFAGPQGIYPGLDQVDVLLPRSLASATPYSVLIQLIAGGQPSNPVRVTIQ
jgi:uncharacterized protein (TIGR03437 family)